MKSGFASGLLAGIQAARQGIDVFNQSKDREKADTMDAEIKAAMDAKPTSMQGYLPEDASSMEAIAGAKDDAGNPLYTMGQDGNGAYTVQSNLPMTAPDGTQQAAPGFTLPTRQLSEFMGQRTEGQMAPEQMQAARTQAVAAAVMKKDPLAGFNMQRQVSQDAKDNQRFGWEKARSESEVTRLAQDDADRGIKRDIDAKVGEEFKKRLTNADGTQRPATVDDYLTSSMHRAGLLTDAGKIDQAGTIISDHNHQAMAKIQLEGEQRKQSLIKAAAGVASGDMTGVKDFYNSHVPDGAKVKDVTKDPKTGAITINRETMDGRPMPPTTLKDTGQLLATLNSFQDPMALYNWSQNEFVNNLKTREVKIKEDDSKNTARHQKAMEGFAEQGTRDRKGERDDIKAKASAAVALYVQKNPSATPAEIEAVRTGVVAPFTKKDGKFKVEAGDITSLLGEPAVDSTGKPILDPLSQKQMVNRNLEREQDFFKWMTANGIDDTDEALAKYPGLRGTKAAAPAGGAAPTPEAVSYLKANPALADQYDAKYGPGAAKKALGK